MESVVIENRQQGSFAVSGTGAESDPLTAGEYDVWSDQDVYIKVGSTPADVTTTTGYKVYQGNTVPVHVEPGKKIGGITSGAVGTLWYHRVS